MNINLKSSWVRAGAIIKSVGTTETTVKVTGR